MDVVPATTRPPLLARLWGRLRHGLLMQEILDRVNAAGLVLMPYIVTVESAALLPEVRAVEGYQIRDLGSDDAAEIVNISTRSPNLANVLAAARDGRCYGVTQSGQLVGYTWAFVRYVSVPATGTVLFDLNADEAYLMGMYIAPAHRGARLAPWLRAHVLRSLAAEGRTNCYSISLLFNRSSRRFKARLGAQERELRLYLHLHRARLPGTDLRLLRRGAPLRIPTLRRVASDREDARGG